MKVNRELEWIIELRNIKISQRERSQDKNEIRILKKEIRELESHIAGVVSNTIVAQQQLEKAWSITIKEQNAPKSNAVNCIGWVDNRNAL